MPSVEHKDSTVRTDAFVVAVTPAAPAPIPVPYPVGASALLAVAARAAAEATEAAAEDLSVHLAEVGERAVTTLDEFAEAGTKLAQVTQDVANGDLGALADLIGGQLASELSEALSDLLEGAVPELGGVLKQAGGALSVGSGNICLMVELAPPLQWGHGIVETISELLEAMALGL